MIRLMSNSQRAIAAAIKLLEAEGYQVSRKASPTAWDYTLLRKYTPNQTATEVPALRDL